MTTPATSPRPRRPASPSTTRPRRPPRSVPPVSSAAPSTADPSKWDVTATAADDKGVTRVEFYADDAKFAEDITAPYTATWDTLDPLTTAYDGSHTLTTVANSTGSEYRASFDLNAAGTSDDVMPQLMTANTAATAQEPYASPTPTRTLTSAPSDSTTGAALAQAADTTTATGCPTGSYCPSVTVTNTSTVAWKNNSTGTDLRVWYRWYAPNGVVLYEGAPPATTSLRPCSRGGPRPWRW